MKMWIEKCNPSKWEITHFVNVEEYKCYVSACITVYLLLASAWQVKVG